VRREECPDYRKWLRFYLDFCWKYGPNDMQEGISQPLTLPEVPKRPGVINCASYAQGVRVANVEIATSAKSSNTKTDLSGLACSNPMRSCCARFRKNFAFTTWPLRTSGRSGEEDRLARRPALRFTGREAENCQPSEGFKSSSSRGSRRG
jgi:hypothetical protein